MRAPPLGRVVDVGSCKDVTCDVSFRQHDALDSDIQIDVLPTGQQERSGAPLPGVPFWGRDPTVAELARFAAGVESADPDAPATEIGTHHDGGVR
jgi:hypothetical protein